MIRARDNHRFSGREFAPQDVSLIREVVEGCSGISRTELSYTVCELLECNRSPPPSNIFRRGLERGQHLFYQGLLFERYIAKDLDSAACMFQ